MTDSASPSVRTSVTGGTDWPQVYRENLEAVTHLASQLSNEQLSLRVPGTPDWTVHDILAHLAGGSSDVLSGRMDDAPSETWTARHVDERAARTPDALVGELNGNADALVGTLAGNGSPAVVWDIAVHHADLHEAMGRGRPPESMWRPVVDAAGPMMLKDKADAFAGVDRYELFRGIFSRRSRRQMAGWGTGLAQADLDAVPVFGPRDDDGVVPE
jgi:uncharacterized protein (TIGR03083 family)